MKKLFLWALAVVVLEVIVYQVCVVVWGHDAAFTVVAIVAVTPAAIAAVFVIVALATKEENLPYWRVMAVVLGEAGAILGWMLLGQHSQPLAAGTLAAGVGIMALAAFVCVPNPKNEAAAVGQ